MYSRMLTFCSKDQAHENGGVRTRIILSFLALYILPLRNKILPKKEKNLESGLLKLK